MESHKQHKQFWVILSIVFLSFLGISIPYLIFPALFLNPEYSILSDNTGASTQALLLGVTLAVYPLGQFIGSPILGALSDDYGRKRLLSSSLFVAAVCNLFTGVAIEGHQIGLLILSRFLAGLMEGNIAIARAMAADLTLIPKEKTFGKINASASIAFILGPFLGGVMTDKSLLASLTPSTPFYFICFFFFGLSILASLMLDQENLSLEKEVRTIWQRINIPKRLSILFKNQRLRFLMITSTVFTLAVDIFYEFGPVFLTIKWTLNPSDLIFYNGILCLALALGNGWLPTFASSFITKRQAIIGSSGGFAALLIALVLIESPFLMYLFFAISGLLIGLIVTTITVKISDSVPSSIQGEVMGVQIALRVLGDALICLCGGAMLLVSPQLILFLAAGLSVASMAYYAFRAASHKVEARSD